MMGVLTSDTLLVVIVAVVVFANARHFRDATCDSNARCCSQVENCFRWQSHRFLLQPTSRPITVVVAHNNDIQGKTTTDQEYHGLQGDAKKANALFRTSLCGSGGSCGTVPDQSPRAGPQRAAAAALVAMRIVASPSSEMQRIQADADLSAGVCSLAARFCRPPYNKSTTQETCSLLRSLGALRSNETGRLLLGERVPKPDSAPAQQQSNKAAQQRALLYSSRGIAVHRLCFISGRPWFCQSWKATMAVSSVLRYVLRYVQCGAFQSSRWRALGAFPRLEADGESRIRNGRALTGSLSSGLETA
ncbi:hypothetical protein B0J11DRAFT_571145 [Dendryphion nanum]|uniref:Secreted protein n=1 Tax=Dendryphion nanum TaxID=256645 RepID=A0A9P9IFZ1_9PLEO|nr:hypothetical protein B0J11DRAFT_571145 [Dendryphion nanum]